MEWTALIGPVVIAAIVSGLVTIVGHYFSSRSSQNINLDKIAAERDLAERKFKAEVDLAERKFAHEKAIHDYRRVVEFGEDLLASFYKLQDVVRSVRGPFAYSSEGEKRKRAPNEDETAARQRDGYYVPTQRLLDQSAFISELSSKKYRAQAVFGNDVHRAFDLAHETLQSIRVASSMLVEQVGQPGRDPEFRRELEKDIWDLSRPDKPDKLAEKIIDAITIVEKAVRPALGARPSSL